MPDSRPPPGAAPWTFARVESAAAVALSAERAHHAFQNPRWVQAVAAARGRRHLFVAVRAERPGAGAAVLFGSLHRRAGLAVFESMPMGGYGGWVGEDALTVDEEYRLNACWLRQAAWPVVRLTSAPGRGVTLPPAPAWPLPERWRRRLAGRDLQTHVLDLAADDAQRLQRVKPNVRSYLRRVDALGFEFERGGEGALADLCTWYRRGSQNWAAPAGTLLPDGFFAALQDPAGLEIWRARREGQTVAAAAFLLGGSEVQYQASGSARVAGPVSAMDALLWSAARHYRERGYRTLNMGASDGLESVRRFKEKFGAQAQVYRCETYLLPAWARTGGPPSATGGRP